MQRNGNVFFRMPWIVNSYSSNSQIKDDDPRNITGTTVGLASGKYSVKTSSGKYRNLSKPKTFNTSNKILNQRGNHRLGRKGRKEEQTIIIAFH